MKIRLIDNDIVGVFLEKYDPRLIGLIKSNPHARFNAKARFWHFPIDGATIEYARQTIEKLVAEGFTTDEGIGSRLDHFAPLKNDYIVPIMPQTAPFDKLYPYQKEIVNFMANNGSTLNASFVGSGKTLTSLAICKLLQADKVLIIAPKSVVLQWAEQEIPKWLPEARVCAISGGLKARTKLYDGYSTGFMVMGYETARVDIERLTDIGFDIIVTDEAHRLANPRTKTYKAFEKLKSRRRYALTATPVMNKAEDLYGIINWLRPGVLGNYYSFLNRYSVKDHFGSIKGYKNLQVLADQTSPFIIRKTLDEVDLQLPPYTETILPVELSSHERKLYNQIKSELLFEIEQHLINKIDNPTVLQMSVVKMGKLMELCDSLELLGEESQSSKLETLKDHLESSLNNGQKAIIITRFSRMAEILHRELAIYNPLIITGQTKDRESVLAEFRNKADCKILVGSEAIGQGLNLQTASLLYNFDSAWNPSKMEQRAGRIYRNGQTRPVFVYNLVCNKTVEGWLQKKLATKKELSASLLPKSFGELKELLQ